MPIPASSILPTVDDLKVHLNRTDITDDSELLDFLDVAVRRVEAEVGRLDAVTVTDEVHSGSEVPLVLQHYPVLEITAASYWDGTSITTDDLEVSPSGVVDWRYGTAGRFQRGARNVRISYTVGRTDLDPLLREAILEFARDSWSASQRGGGSARPAFPGQDYDADTDAPAASGYARAMSAIQAYLHGGSVGATVA